jgi:hypothetical protein
LSLNPDSRNCHQDGQGDEYAKHTDLPSGAELSSGIATSATRKSPRRSPTSEQPMPGRAIRPRRSRTSKERSGSGRAILSRYGVCNRCARFLRPGDPERHSTGTRASPGDITSGVEPAASCSAVSASK